MTLIKGKSIISGFSVVIALTVLHGAVKAYAQQSSVLEHVIPPSATVLSLTGLNFNITNYMPQEFRGRFSKPPYQMVQVRYPASIGSQSISKGVRALDAAMHETSGPLIVLAHSQGAQVASHWMREHANDPAAPTPDRVMFILLGNPLRACGGSGIGHREFGGTIGEPTPTNTRWAIVDVARRYDGWADSPSDKCNRFAIKNANMGKRTYHTHYDEVNLNEPSNTVWQDGNTTFVLTQEPLPIWRWTSRPPEWVERNATAYVESAYKRPVNDVKIAPVSNAHRDVLWSLKLLNWGVPM